MKDGALSVRYEHVATSVPQSVLNRRPRTYVEVVFNSRFGTRSLGGQCEVMLRCSSLRVVVRISVPSMLEGCQMLLWFVHLAG